MGLNTSPEFSDSGYDFASCIFCGERNLSKEHVWGNWLNKLYPDDQPKKRFSHSVLPIGTSTAVQAIEPPPRVRGRLDNSGSAFSKRFRAVCKKCNSGWMSNIENQYKKLFTQIDPLKDFRPTSDQIRVLQQWFFLKLCIQQAILVADRRRGELSEMQLRDVSFIDRLHFQGWQSFFEERKVPKSFRLLLFKNFRVEFSYGSTTLSSAIGFDGVQHSLVESCAMLLPKIGCLAVTDTVYETRSFDSFVRNSCGPKGNYFLNAKPWFAEGIPADHVCPDRDVAKLAVDLLKKNEQFLSDSSGLEYLQATRDRDQPQETSTRRR